MRKIVVRGIAARKLRAALTALAVLLGVMMVAGTYVLTDTINTSFDRIFEQASKGIDVKVTPHATVDREDETHPPPFDAALLERVRAVEGVEEAAGGIFQLGAILGADGEPIQTRGPPNFIASVVSDRFSSVEYTEGRRPASAGEVAIDEFTADRHGFRVGDRVGVLGRVRARSYELVGVARFGDVASFGGASLALLTLAEAQRITRREGRLDEIDVAAAAGTSPPELRDRLRRVLPRSVDVRTGAEQAAKDSADNREAFGFLTTVLLVFAAVAVFVGGFIIFNTFSITVSQRKREFGMLRTLGASRRQILAAVGAEALAIGVAASVLGILAGIGFAKGVNALFKAIGIDLPSSGTVVAARTIAVALAVGILLTIVAALAPAVRATRVSPLEALREGEGMRRRPSRLRTPAGIALAAAGLAVMLYGLFGPDDSDAGLTLVGAGAVAVFLGVAMLSPLLVPPLAAAAGWPLVRLRGLIGQLARENALRNPGRTAVTAAALMIGLALVTFVAVFTSGLRAGVANTIERSFAGDVILQHTNGFAPIPAAAGEAVARVPGVEVVSPWRASEARVRGQRGDREVSGLDPRTAARVFRFEWEEGGPGVLAGLGRREAVIDIEYGRRHGVGVGDVLTVLTPTGRTLRFEVRGSIRDPSDFAGDFIVPLAVVATDFGEEQDAVALAKVAGGTPVASVRRRIDALLDRQFPTVQALDQQELEEKQREQFNQLLALVYALLSLAVVVSIFGIVNTLVLTIHERTRELGLLRAVGMSRRQVRRLVRYESVITALIGGVLGAALGMLLSLVVSRPLADEGFVLVVPVASIAVFIVLAGVGGVVAAIPPARRAARLDVLEALAYE